MQTELTLIFVKEGDRVLLGKKKRSFGMGKYNGYGGKTEPGEDPLTAIKRELKEEADVAVESIKKIGEITFYMNKKDVPGANTFNMQDELFVHVFIGRGLIGEPVETDEMEPKWFNVNEVPFENMWEDDPYWFPYMIKEIPFSGYCKFAGDDKTITEYNFKEVEEYK